jgi:hypothetical protein
VSKLRAEKKRKMKLKKKRGRYIGDGSDCLRTKIILEKKKLTVDV